ncbi:juvenile hormone esterase-like isoform X2 [Onthophagus taurus]
MSDDEVSKKSFMDQCMFQMRDTTSLVAINYALDPPDLVGCCLNRVVHKDDFGRVFSGTIMKDGEAQEKCMKIRRTLSRKVNIFESFNCDVYLKIYTVCIKPEYRHCDYGTDFLKCTFNSARSLHIPVVMGIFTAHTIQRRAKKLGMKAPIPKTKWNGIIDGSLEHAVCPQRNIYTRTDLIEGDEDCLYLNVYTPKLSYFEDNEPLAVMVWFHGGGYHCGGGNITWYNPTYLLDYNVILVIPNYRLGALGFLSTFDEECPGNNGLKDQTLALKWIQENIHKFGGDPRKVTLFGESAGGASVHFHMLSPSSKGLFARGIAQSGTALTLWSLAPKDEGKETANKLAQLLNCTTDSSREMLDCLRKVDSYKIIALDKKFMEWDTDPMIPFKPVVEPKIKEAFLSEHPIDIIKSGGVYDVPWITGLTTDEGSLRVPGIFANEHLVEELNQYFDKVVPIGLFYRKTSQNPGYITKQLRTFYFGDKVIDMSSKQSVIDMFTDGWFGYAAYETIKLHRKHTKSPIYYYSFNHRGKYSMSQRFGDEYNDYGVCHADDLQYLFHFDELFNGDAKVSKILAETWTNFVKTGNPTPDDNELGIKWKPISTDDMEYLEIGPDGELKMLKGLNKERNEFWSSLNVGTGHESNVRDEL